MTFVAKHIPHRVRVRDREGGGGGGGRDRCTGGWCTMYVLTVRDEGLVAVCALVHGVQCMYSQLEIRVWSR